MNPNIHRLPSARERRQLLRSQVSRTRVQCTLIASDHVHADPYDGSFQLAPGMELLQMLAVIESEQRHLGRVLNQEESRPLLQYLQLLDKKIQLIAQAMVPEIPESPIRLVNISEGGLSLMHPSPLPVGTVLHLVLQGREPAMLISCIGEVVHCSGTDIQHILGIRFTALREHDRQTICRLVIRQGLDQATKVHHNKAVREKKS